MRQALDDHLLGTARVALNHDMRRRLVLRLDDLGPPQLQAAREGGGEGQVVVVLDRVETARRAQEGVYGLQLRRRRRRVRLQVDLCSTQATRWSILMVMCVIDVRVHSQSFVSYCGLRRHEC